MKNIILTEKEKDILFLLVADRILFLLVTDRILDRIPLPLTEKEIEELDDLLETLSEE